MAQLTPLAKGLIRHRSRRGRFAGLELRAQGALWPVAAAAAAKPAAAGDDCRAGQQPKPASDAGEGSEPTTRMRRSAARPTR
jgi:hypothetical protein